MTERIILARLSFPEPEHHRSELVLSEAGSSATFVRYATHVRSKETGQFSHERLFMAEPRLAEEALGAATHDFVNRYLGLVVALRFGGDRLAAFRSFFLEAVLGVRDGRIH